MSRLGGDSAELLQVEVAFQAGERVVVDAVRAVDAQQHRSGALMAAVDSGQSDDLVGAMIESQKASVSFSALMQVRNKLSSAFDDIMKMPL